MGFEAYLLEQLQNHPSLQPQDAVKLCYQAAFGAEHLLADADRAAAYLRVEYESVAPQDIPLYECVSPEVCRVNLAAWKYHGLPVEWLFRIFSASAKEKYAGEVLFRAYLKQAAEVLAGNAFSGEDWERYLREYEKNGISPVHHSEIYRKQEHPAYRIIHRKYTRIFPILVKATSIKKHPCIIAIDGRAASGKSTMAAWLSDILQGDIIRMDDFFLPMELRLAERFTVPGNNVHHERFAEEVLPHLGKAESFSYRIFDCGRMDYHGKREIDTGDFRIVEGSYSCHPLFGRYADITVFSDVAAEEQLARILRRNGEAMAELFRSRWIPLEEDYFEKYLISETTDIIV